jgi:Dual specificity phosphatase, catalytic domain
MPHEVPGPSADDDTVATPFGPLAPAGAVPPRRRSYWVVVDRLAGGAYPYADKPADGDVVLAGLLDAGIDAFVDLTEAGMGGQSDRQLTDYGESPAMSSEVQRIRHPIHDLGIPIREGLVETLDTIDRLLEEGRTVYVHCWGGVGRTGVVVGAWLIRHGMATGEDVLEVLRRLRTADASGWRDAPEMPEQVAFLESYRE